MVGGSGRHCPGNGPGPGCVDAAAAFRRRARAGGDDATWPLAAPGRAVAAREALVSAAGRPVPVPAGQDAADAAAAGRALVQLLDDPRALISSVHCSPQGSFNLLAATAPWAAGPRHSGVMSVFGHGPLSPRVARVRVASWAWWRQAAAMFRWPVILKMLIERLRRVAMTWGPLPVRVWEASSP